MREGGAGGLPNLLYLPWELSWLLILSPKFHIWLALCKVTDLVQYLDFSNHIYQTLSSQDFASVSFASYTTDEVHEPDKIHHWKNIVNLIANPKTCLFHSCVLHTSTLKEAIVNELKLEKVSFQTKNLNDLYCHWLANKSKNMILMHSKALQTVIMRWIVWLCSIHTCFLKIISWLSIVFFKTSFSESVYIWTEFRSKSRCTNILSSQNHTSDQMFHPWRCGLIEKTILPELHSPSSYRSFQELQVMK